ncbi:MAG: ABC transporter substrate-binding protein [Lachnospiraceae bacterium]|nr:ABC transporter substrate-binding protein [Lachnospiraceae bacterium]
MRSKRLLALLLAGVMVVSVLAGCGGNNEPEQESDSSATEETVSVNDNSSVETTGIIATEVNVANSDPVSLMPLRSTGNGKNVLNEIYECLVDRDGFAGEIYGVIAKDWKWDGNDFVVNIYDYVYDHAGNHITADDVVYSFVTSWEAGYSQNQLYINCDSIEATDEYTVVFHFLPEKVDTLGNWRDMFTAQAIFSQKAWEDSTDEMASNAVGTGPYIVKEFMAGSYCTLVRNENYWQTDESLIGPQHRANVETITYKFITESQQLVNALKTGEIDYTNNIVVEALGEFEASDDWATNPELELRIFSAWPNCLEGTPFSDINLRAAFFYALDVDQIIDAMGGTKYAQKIRNFGASQVPEYNPEWDTLDNYYNKDGADLEKAKEYLEKSSYNGEVIQLWYETGTYKPQLEAVTLVAGAALESLGINYEINTKESGLSDMLKETSSDWDIIFMDTGCNGSLFDYIKNDFNTTFYEGGAGNYFDETLDQLYLDTYCTSGATPENIDKFWGYISDNFYNYGLFQRITYEVYRKDLISDTRVKTFRTWTIPGSFEYAE